MIPAGNPTLDSAKRVKLEPVEQQNHEDLPKQLPTEILHNIFSFLDDPRDRSRTARANTVFRTARLHEIKKEMLREMKPHEAHKVFKEIFTKHLNKEHHLPSFENLTTFTPSSQEEILCKMKDCYLEVYNVLDNADADPEQRAEKGAKILVDMDQQYKSHPEWGFLGQQINALAKIGYDNRESIDKSVDAMVLLNLHLNENRINIDDYLKITNHENIKIILLSTALYYTSNETENFSRLFALANSIHRLHESHPTLSLFGAEVSMFTSVLDKLLKMALDQQDYHLAATITTMHPSTEMDIYLAAKYILGTNGEEAQKTILKDHLTTLPGQRREQIEPIFDKNFQQINMFIRMTGNCSIM